MKHRSRNRKRARQGKRTKLPAYLPHGVAVDLRPGEIAQVIVAHDSDCPQLRGGQCACTPDVTVSGADGRLSDVGLGGVPGPGQRRS